MRAVRISANEAVVVTAPDGTEFVLTHAELVRAATGGTATAVEPQVATGRRGDPGGARANRLRQLIARTPTSIRDGLVTVVDREAELVDAVRGAADYAVKRSADIKRLATRYKMPKLTKLLTEILK